MVSMHVSLGFFSCFKIVPITLHSASCCAIFACHCDLLLTPLYLIHGVAPFSVLFPLYSPELQGIAI